MDFLKYPYLSEKTVHIFIGKGFPYAKKPLRPHDRKRRFIFRNLLISSSLKNLYSLMFHFSIVGLYLYLMTISYLVPQAVHLQFQEVP